MTASCCQYGTVSLLALAGLLVTYPVVVDDSGLLSGRHAAVGLAYSDSICHSESSSSAVTGAQPSLEQPLLGRLASGYLR